MKIRDRIVDFRRVRASELVPNDQNWRTHPERQKTALAAMIEEIGFADVAIARDVNGSLELLDGHLRRELAGDAEIPVVVVNLDDSEARKLLLTLDPLAGMAKSNDEKLEALLRQINSESDEVQKLVESLGREHGIDLTKPLEDPSAEIDKAAELQKKWKTERGQLWLIKGKHEHRLLCGDATCEEDAGRLMDGERAGLVFTSPPYLQQRDYGQRVSDWDSLMCEVFSNLLVTDESQLLVNLGLVHREGEWLPYWNQWIEWMREHGWRRFGWYVWDQGFGLPGNWNGRFAPAHEWLFHFNMKPLEPLKWVSKKPENIKPRNRGESTMRKTDGTTAAFTNPGASAQSSKIPDSVIRVTRQVGSDGHPAQYPVALAAFMIQCWPGTVYDPFLGSGTTMVAAEQFNRRCYGIEIEPAYVAVSLERMSKLGCHCELQ